MSAYHKGRRFEYLIRKLYEADGWTVIRCAASKPIDLIAFKQGKVQPIECKIDWKHDKQEIERLRELSDKIGFPILLIYKKQNNLIAQLIDGKGLKLGYVAFADRAPKQSEAIKWLSKFYY